MFHRFIAGVYTWIYTYVLFSIFCFLLFGFLLQTTEWGKGKGGVFFFVVTVRTFQAKDGLFA